MNSWTDERAELLKKLWQDGLSASQIANKLGGVSRSAVIGKVHRLGLSGRATPYAPGRQPRGPAAPAKPRKPSQPRAFSNPIQTRVFGSPTAYTPNAADAFTPAAPIIFDAACACRLEDLTPTRCKWPIGDPAAPTFVFCGRSKDAEAGPYCTDHAQIAYQPAEKKKTAKELVRSLRKYIAA